MTSPPVLGAMEKARLSFGTMSDVKEDSPEALSKEEKRTRRKKKWKRRRKALFLIFLIFCAILTALRAAAPALITRYVNKVIDKNQLYDGKIGGVGISLWKGEYSIYDIKLSKVTGNVPVPLFSAKRIDLAIQWDALLHRKIVGQIEVIEPEINFVDTQGADESQQQFGAGGPWLGMIKDLFPFDINRCDVTNGSAHLRVFNSKPQVDVFVDNLYVQVEDLTNVKRTTQQLFSTITINGRAMGTAPITLQTKFDPFSYQPSFQLGLKLIGLDVTQLNDFSRAYAGFDFKKGWFDLVVEIDCTEGTFDGYVKPLFRNLQIFSLSQDLPPNKDLLNTFWQALLGTGEAILTNRPRDQFATFIPVTGLLIAPKPDILSAAGNVLRNCFIRAYLPRLNGYASQIDDMKFGPGSEVDPKSVVDPTAPGNIP